MLTLLIGTQDEDRLMEPTTDLTPTPCDELRAFVASVARFPAHDCDYAEATAALFSFVTEARLLLARLDAEEA